MSTKKVPTFDLGSIVDLSAEQIGDQLLRCCKQKDGIGATVRLERDEVVYVKVNFGGDVGKELARMLRDALTRAGKNPNVFEHVYDPVSCDFYTTPARTTAEMAPGI